MKKFLSEAKKNAVVNLSILSYFKSSSILICFTVEHKPKPSSKIFFALRGLNTSDKIKRLYAYA